MAPRLAGSFDAFRASAAKSPFQAPTVAQHSQSTTTEASSALQPGFLPSSKSNDTAHRHNSIPAWGSPETTISDEEVEVEHGESASSQKGGDMTVLSQLYAVENKIMTELKSLKAQQLMLKEQVDNLETANVNGTNVTDAQVPAPGTTNHPAADAVGVTARPSIPSNIKGSESSDDIVVQANKDDGMPHFIRHLKPPALTSLTNHPLPVHTMQTFSYGFLRAHLGGEEWSPGFFASSEVLPLLLGKARHLESMTSKHSGKDGKPDHLDAATKAKERGTGTTYYIIDTLLQPYVPTTPGNHGALLAGFLHDFDDSGDRYKDVPVFISVNPPNTRGSADAPKETQQYMYIGSYTQSRWSDRLSQSEYHTCVPRTLSRFWATLMSNPDRPAWLTEHLHKSLGGPKPTYDGVMPESIDKAGLWKRVVEEDFRYYLNDLKMWGEDAEEALKDLTIKYALELFEKSDCDDIPGIRFWWEYLECTGFERNFYYALASASKATNGIVKQPNNTSTLAYRPAAPKQGSHDNVDKPTPQAGGWDGANEL